MYNEILTLICSYSLLNGGTERSSQVDDISLKVLKSDVRVSSSINASRSLDELPRNDFNPMLDEQNVIAGKGSPSESTSITSDVVFTSKDK